MRMLSSSMMLAYSMPDQLKGCSRYKQTVQRHSHVRIPNCMMDRWLAEQWHAFTHSLADRGRDAPRSSREQCRRRTSSWSLINKLEGFRSPCALPHACRPCRPCNRAMMQCECLACQDNCRVQGKLQSASICTTCSIGILQLNDLQAIHT